MRNLKKGKKSASSAAVIAMDETTEDAGDSHEYVVSDGVEKDLYVCKFGKGYTVADVLRICSDELGKQGLQREQAHVEVLVAHLEGSLKPTETVEVPEAAKDGEPEE